MSILKLNSSTLSNMKRGLGNIYNGVKGNSGVYAARAKIAAQNAEHNIAEADLYADQAKDHFENAKGQAMKTAEVFINGTKIAAGISIAGLLLSPFAFGPLAPVVGVASAAIFALKVSVPTGLVATSIVAAPEAYRGCIKQGASWHSSVKAKLNLADQYTQETLDIVLPKSDDCKPFDHAFEQSEEPDWLALALGAVHLDPYDTI